MTEPVELIPAQLSRRLRTLAQCAAASAVLALLTYGGFVLQVSLVTISFLYLLIVVAVASLFGFWQASLISLLAVACLDYFFTQPILHFYMTDMREVVALGALNLPAGELLVTLQVLVAGEAGELEITHTRLGTVRRRSPGHWPVRLEFHTADHGAIIARMPRLGHT